VADLHVVEDLGHRESGDARDPRRRHEADEHEAAAGGGQAPLGLDHLLDVLDVALAEVLEHAGADGVELGAEGLELLVAETGGGGGHVGSS
jgi:hypothetical protein